MRQRGLTVNEAIAASITGCFMPADANLEGSDAFVIFVLQDTFNLK
jgi:hypothetical protein